MYEGREIHVSNIHWKADENDLKELFSQYGTVETVRIPRKVDGGSKGFGYVVFASKVSISSSTGRNHDADVFFLFLFRMRRMLHLPCISRNSVPDHCR